MRQKVKERRRQERAIEYRVSKIFTLRSSGLTFRDIASQVGITRQRVHQLYIRNGGIPFEREIRPGQKRCSHCKQWLPITNFYQNKSVDDGLSNQCRACDDCKSRNYQTVHREKVREIAKRSYLKHKDRAAARALAHDAFPVSQPCRVCGKPGERHHEDYATPLDITWLCRKHHAARERERRNLN